MPVDPFETQPSDDEIPKSFYRETDALPRNIGRFRIDRILGHGGFGVVYLGFDEQLGRKVAIKVPKPQFIQRASDRDLYLREARTVAGLEHPNIVPVLEVGSDAEFPIYIVSKFIVGKDLAEHLKISAPTFHQTVTWIIDIADALREAHRKGFTHRDVKPQNILVDHEGKVYLVDFGLALADRDVGNRLPAGGTPAYMSPEQARGEGHRVDGRSDLFSLGILFYELLCGRRPFHGNSHQELFEQITEFDPKPLRQWIESVPQELERICLKMLAKRKSERYSSAKDLLDDLRAFLAKLELDPQAAGFLSRSQVDLPNSNITKNANSDATPVAILPATNGPALKIVPKGLRSFDHRDSDFFLDLLPGARDRHGLPESISFWKSRIEERDPDQTFAVGLVYGPSGCGKSSMMKAGLLPRLGPHVVPVYLEATSDNTEQALWKSIRKKLDCKDADMAESLPVLLHAARCGRILPRGKKLLVVLDQFEQWLFAHPRTSGTTLLDALHQCDGAKVQAVVMVRDDFWMAATRFFRDLDIRLVEGNNSAAVDLFDIVHAEHVLEAFGRAFGKLESEGKQAQEARKQFISDAVRGMSEQGKVISVRIALFAEMMKAKSWTPESLREVGGTAGVGATFLEETFSAAGAPPQYRFHQEATKLALLALLPDAGTNIKGHQRSIDELRVACRYERRPRDFQELIRILDGELRLITPVDSSSIGDEESQDNDQADQNQADQPTIELRKETRFSSEATQYQLTHDYLVPSLRDWLTRKKRETRKGRAELKLADRASTWSGRRENRQLPTLSEWIGIRLLTDAQKWTTLERTVMRRAAQVHGRWWGGLLLVAVLAGIGLQQWISAVRLKNLKEQTQILVDSVQNNLGASVPLNQEKLRRLPSGLVLTELQNRYQDCDHPRQKLAIAFALAAYQHLDADYLVSRIENIVESDASNFANALQSNTSLSLASIRAEADKCIQNSSWRRKAKLAIAALIVGDTSLAMDMCKIDDRPDPEQRTLFIDEFPHWHSQLSSIHDLVAQSDSPSLRSGICLAVGQLADEKWSDSDKRQWTRLASLWFMEKQDTTTHSAAGWLLRRLGAPVPMVPESEKMLPQRDWFVNSVNITLLKMAAKTPDRVASIDPLDPYRQQLTAFSELQDAEFEKPELLKARALAHYQIGNMERAMEDLDRYIAKSAPSKDPDIQQHRTLALARLGRADEANASLAEYLQLKIPKFKGIYTEIQVPAWLGDFDEASRRLDDAMKHWENVQQTDQYLLARAASVLSKAATGTNVELATKFANRTMELLLDLEGRGYDNREQLLLEPDFAHLHGDYRFASLLGTSIREFWIADREVTRGQFELFLEDPDYPKSEKPEKWPGLEAWLSPSKNDPAQKVSWYDAVMFCNWLSLKEGRKPCYERTGLKEKNYQDLEFEQWRLKPSGTGYRLPSKAEWEYACRAGTTTEFSMGNDETILARYCQMYPSKKTAACGSLLPNGWGLHDVHGNANEWCEEVFDVKGIYHWYRGGDWKNVVEYCRFSLRTGMDPGTRPTTFGFRVALSPNSLQSSHSAK